LGAICFGDSEKLAPVLPWPLEEWREHYPYWNEPNILARKNLGDCYAIMVDTILTLEAPFPGDYRYDSSDLRPELRFRVCKEEETHDYEILDRLTGTRTTVARVLVENAEFDISYWYAEQRTRALRLTAKILHQQHLGDAVAIVTKKLLIDGIASLYPGTKHDLDPEDRFQVGPSELEVGNYVIGDMDLETEVSIPKLWLEEPAFVLVSWYRKHLDQHDLFEQKYYETHHER
jgi:hypothetical protein